MQQVTKEKNSSNFMNTKATIFWKVGCATQQEIKEKNSNNFINRRVTIFWKVGCAEK